MHAMTEILCGGSTIEEIRIAAMHVARAQIELERIQIKKIKLSKPKLTSASGQKIPDRDGVIDMSYFEAISNINFSLLERESHKGIFGRRLPTALVKKMIKSQKDRDASETLSIDRYEKRALSRRRTAIKNLDDETARQSKNLKFGETNSKTHYVPVS